MTNSVMDENAADEWGLEVAYLQVEVADLDSFAEFVEGRLGLIRLSQDSDSVRRWRLDEASYRLVATEGPANDATHLGFEAGSESRFDATVQQLRSIGVDVAEASPQACQDRGVQRLATMPSPLGPVVEVAFGLERTSSPVETPDVPGGFLTAGLGFGHAVFGLTVERFERAQAFAEAGLGMRRSDSLQMGDANNGIFYHCNPRHHSLAIANVGLRPGGGSLHHFMLETKAVDGVGAAYERVLAAGDPVMAGLGRHDNDEMFSFYCQSPAGFEVEIGWDARQITRPWTGDKVYDRVSRWGHAPHPVGV